MMEHFLESLSEQSNKFINEGYLIFDVEDKQLLESIASNFKSYLSEEYDIDIKEFSKIHEFIDVKKLNELRLGFFKKINNKNDFSKIYLKLGKNIMHELVGSELAGNKTVNFSIQLPNDETSILGIHSDTFSGESEFQINLWIPLTNSFETNSMFIFLFLVFYRT